MYVMWNKAAEHWDVSCGQKDTEVRALRLVKSLCYCSVAKLPSILCDPVDSSPPGSPIHGDFLARILEWVAIFFSRGSSKIRDQTGVSCVSR